MFIFVIADFSVRGAVILRARLRPFRCFLFFIVCPAHLLCDSKAKKSRFAAIWDCKMIVAGFDADFLIFAIKEKERSCYIRTKHQHKKINYSKRRYSVFQVVDVLIPHHFEHSGAVPLAGALLKSVPFVKADRIL